MELETTFINKQLVNIYVVMERIKTPNQSAESEKLFVSDTIARGFNETKEGKFVGENLSSLDELINELRTAGL